MTHKERMSYLALVAAILFGIAGCWIAPMGIIHESMLYLIAQLLIFAASVIGVGDIFMKIHELLKHNDQKKGVQANGAA